VFIHIYLFIYFIFLFLNLIWGERFFHWLYTTFILWSTIKIKLGLWMNYNFFSFISRNVHMFHHISTPMPPTIQCIIERTFMTIITWNFVCNFIILVLCKQIALNFHLQAIRVLENVRMETNIRMEFQPCIHP